MSKISKITIVHTVSRKFENALEICSETCQDCSVEVLDVLSVADDNLAKEVDKNSQLILVIGGDGTIISTIRKLLTLEIPFLGINIGKLGFLTDINSDSITEELPKIFNGEYVGEKRPLL